MHIWILVLLLFTACQKKTSVEGQWISSLEEQKQVTIDPPIFQKTPEYFWDQKLVGSFPRITKEFFRCKGSRLNPCIIQKREGKEPIYMRDCAGSSNHSLPIKEGKEFIYPTLLDLLNYIQKTTQKQVVITTGHRCPMHNRYADASRFNNISKHMLGAEVDFYVVSLEESPLEIVTLIQNYYKQSYTDPAFVNFHRLEKEGLNVSTYPWYNKEILIKVYLPSEGRDFDNQHPYPYIGIQIRYDCTNNRSIDFDAKVAESFLRY